MSTRAYVEHLEEYWGGQVPHELEDPDTITELFETGSVTVNIQGKEYVLALDLLRVRTEKSSEEMHTMTLDNMCAAQHEGFYCTREKGHDGEHAAHTSPNCIVERWT